MRIHLIPDVVHIHAQVVGTQDEFLGDVPKISTISMFCLWDSVALERSLDHVGVYSRSGPIGALKNPTGDFGQCISPIVGLDDKSFTRQRRHVYRIHEPVRSQ